MYCLWFRFVSAALVMSHVASQQLLTVRESLDQCVSRSV